MFPILELENIVQIADKTRLNGAKSFGAEFTKVEIAPDGVNYTDCTDGMFLDWQFETVGEKTITLRVTSESGNKEVSKTLLVVSSETDALFSSDDDLKERESDIYRYLHDGKATFLNKHRAAKKEILRELKNDGLIAKDATDLTGLVYNPDALIDWSKYLTLSIIFSEENSGFGVGGQEYFKAKAQSYRVAAELAKLNCIKGKDTDADGVADEVVSIYSCEMVRK